MTTKEQERKALAQIRKIVEGLGEDSYVATAFEGCFEIAEENIDNDWACSMKQKAEAAEKNVKDLTQALNDMSTKLAGQIKATEINHENATAHIKELEEKLQETQRKILREDVQFHLIRFLKNRKADIKADLLRIAEDVADFADTPSDIAFVESVKALKNSREELQMVNWLLEDLQKNLPKIG